MFNSRTLNRFRPSKAALLLTAVAFVLMLVGIVLNYFGGGTIHYWQVLFALSLLAFLVWFSGPPPKSD